jgi:hypothetical protein
LVAYHETFWLISGTAAPVIALAQAVALTDASSVLARAQFEGRRADQIGAEGARIIKRITVRLSWAPGLANLLIQSALLFVALISAYQGSDAWPPLMSALLMLAGLLCLAFVSAVSVWIKQNLSEVLRPIPDEYWDKDWDTELSNFGASLKT